MILFIISVLSSILTIVLWISDVLKNSKGKFIKILYPLCFSLVSIIAIYQYFELDEMKKIENEAKQISKNWPEPNMITFLTKGERFGIILSGQSFLEKHKNKFPDTYKEFKSLMNNRLGNYASKNDFSSKYEEYDNLEDVCGATITMIKNFNPEEKENSDY